MHFFKFPVGSGAFQESWKSGQLQREKGIWISVLLREMAKGHQNVPITQRLRTKLRKNRGKVKKITKNRHSANTSKHHRCIWIQKATYYISYTFTIIFMYSIFRCSFLVLKKFFKRSLYPVTYFLLFLHQAHRNYQQKTTTYKTKQTAIVGHQENFTTTNFPICILKKLFWWKIYINAVT